MTDNLFTRWVKENYIPSSIVYSTENGRKIIGKNNLSPSEFLRPFGVFPPFNLELLGKYTKKINDFRLDFYDSENYKKIPSSTFQEIIDNLLLNPDNVPEWSSSDLKNFHIKDNILSKLKDYTNPWLNEYMKLYFELTKFNECDLLQQPFCFIYVCSITDDLNTIIPNKQKNNKIIPSLISEGIYEEDMPSLILILNDKSDKEKILPKETKESLINNFKVSFARYYMLYWEINDGDKKSTQDLEDIWEPYIHKYDKYKNSKNLFKGLGHGIYVSKDERKRFKDTMFKFFNEYVIKLIQKKITYLDNELTANKKGIKNSFFNMFKKQERLVYNNYFQIYSLSPEEKNEYLLSTLYFYFRCYSEVYESIKFLITDLKSKSIVHYNSAYELRVISNFLLNPSSKENDFIPAFQNYIKTTQFHQAAKSLFNLMKVYEQKGNFSQLINLVMKSVNDIPNKKKDIKSIDNMVFRFAPLMYEQIGIYYLLMPERMKRKFIFYTLLTGNFYKNERNEFIKYSLNDYSSINKFISEKNSSFTRIKQFANEQMGNICTELKYYDGALQFYKNYLEITKFSIDINKSNPHNNFEQLKKSLENVINGEKTGTILGVFNTHDLKIPEVDNTSLLVIEEQDYIISKQSINFFDNPANWLLFNKYSLVPPKKIYLSLTPTDIISLRNLDNIILNKQNFSNFYSKRNFLGNINNKMYVRFVVKNPLTIDLNITDMKLICDFKIKDEIESIPQNNQIEEIEYQHISLTLKKKSSQKIELYIKPLLGGHVIIKGVEITLDNIIIIKHYFNTKDVSKLYSYRKRKQSSIERKRRKSSTSSQHSQGRSSNASHHSNKLFDKKADITFEIIDNDSDVNIEFPMGHELQLFMYQFVLMPIKIKNNSPLKIKRICFFFNDTNSSGRNNKNYSRSVLTDYIYKEIDLFNLPEKNINNEVNIYVPIIPLKPGEIYIKILFKFEEERGYIDHEIRRFLVKLSVKDSIVFNIKENLNKFMKNQIDFNLNTVTYIKNKETLSDLKIGEKVYSTPDIKRLDNNCNEWQLTSNGDLTLHYHKLIFNKERNDNNVELTSLSKKYINEKLNNEINELAKDINFDFIDNEIQNDKYQFHLKNKLCRLLKKDNLIFSWEAKNIIKNEKITGLYFHKTHLKIPSITTKFLRQLMENSCKLTISKTEIGNEKKLIIFDLIIDKSALSEIDSITGYDIFIDDDNNEFNWLGLRKYSIKNYSNKFNYNKDKQSNVNNEISLQFSCITKVKGIRNINKITMSVNSSIPLQKNLILRNFPSPQIISI